MRMTTRALGALTMLGALCCLGAAPGSAAPRPLVAQSGPAQDPVPEAPDAGQGDAGGAGYLPGAQFQRKLDGGPGFVCTATNALHTSQCTASCRKGETADCVDADGGGAPSCGCTRG